MPDPAPTSDRTSICSQLLRQQERALQKIQNVKDEIDAPVMASLLDQLRREGMPDVVGSVQHVLAQVEETLRAIRHVQSEIQRELLASRDHPELPGPDNLPAGLVRFLVERKDTPGFTYEVRQDSVRGWIIHWKEYAANGTVRGSGQFYERPYAWL